MLPKTLSNQSLAIFSENSPPQQPKDSLLVFIFTPPLILSFISPTLNTEKESNPITETASASDEHLYDECSMAGQNKDKTTTHNNKTKQKGTRYQGDASYHIICSIIVVVIVIVPEAEGKLRVEVVVGLVKVSLGRLEMSLCCCKVATCCCCCWRSRRLEAGTHVLFTCVWHSKPRLLQHVLHRM